MTPRPTPRHGTYARANGSPGYRPPCKCEPCLAERRRRDKHAKVRREQGRSPFTTPTTARTHLALLRHTMSWPQLERATGIAQSNLCFIHNGTRTKIRRETEARILAVEPGSHASAGQFIDVTGSMRRVRAMLAVGHSMRTIATAAGSARVRILSIANGQQPTIRRDLADRIAAVYRDLAFAPPPRNKYTARSRNTARLKGWHGPLVWDDIDNPAALPDLDEPKGEQRGRPVRVDADEVLRLTRAGKTAVQIAEQLDCHPRSVARARNRTQAVAA